MPILRKFKRKKNGVDETVHLGALAQNITQDSTHRFVTDAEIQAWNSKPGSTSGLDNNVVTFSEAATRENLQSGEKLSISLGKIKKWFSDLGAAAFMAVANNCTTTAAGSALDARQGKVLMDKANQLSSEIDNIYNTVQTEITNDVAGGSYIAQEDFLMQVNLYCNISDSAVDCAVQVNGILRSNLQATNPTFNMLKTDTIKIFKGDKITSTQTNTGAVRLFKYNK